MKAITISDLHGMPIVISYSFLAFWIAAIAISYFIGGLSNCIVIAICVGVLVSHEFAHLRECYKFNVPVRKMVFEWWGAYIDNTQPKHLYDHIRIVYAGIKDTMWYAIVLLLALAFVHIIGRTFGGINFAPTNDALRILTNTATGIALIGLSNVLPINFIYKNEPVTTDGNFIFVNSKILKSSRTS